MVTIIQDVLKRIEEYKKRMGKRAICWIVEDFHRRDCEHVKGFLAQKFEEYYYVDPTIEGGYWFLTQDSINDNKITVAEWYEPRIEFLERVLKDIEQ